MVSTGQSPRFYVLANHSNNSNFWMSYSAHPRNSGQGLVNLT